MEGGGGGGSYSDIVNEVKTYMDDFIYGIAVVFFLLFLPYKNRETHKTFIRFYRLKLKCCQNALINTYTLAQFTFLYLFYR